MSVRPSTPRRCSLTNDILVFLRDHPEDHVNNILNGTLDAFTTMLVNMRDVLNDDVLSTFDAAMVNERENLINKLKENS